MALVVLHDPYEWFDPERGRQGILIHTSQLDEKRINLVMPLEQAKRTWPEVWTRVDEETSVYEYPPPFVIKGEFTRYYTDGRPPGDHPYEGIDVYCVYNEPDGKTYIYPNKEAADAHERPR